ncbi:MAG TPA: fumarylacetoacetase [Streptosporangiales bacterium]
MSFDAATLPYGVYSLPGDAPRVGVAVGDDVLDVARALGDETFATGSLNPFLAAGPDRWRLVRRRLTELVGAGEAGPYLRPLAEVTPHLPFTVADYVDFYASEHHASNLGRILRPNEPPLVPNWKHLPIGYHGRSGTVVPSGTPVVRPCGQRKPPDAAAPGFGPAERLDVEVELGFVVGTPSRLGEPVPTSAFADHVFGVVLVNDWSARDLQAWEQRPLGPFLAKSFATSISPWVVPLDALTAARVHGPVQDPEPLPYLRRSGDWGLDIAFELRLNGEVVSRPPYTAMYWTPDQMLAHLTVNGASLRTGDLYASGTVSGPEPRTWGSFVELTRAGAEPLVLADGSTRAFVQDGDEVVITATARGAGGGRIALGEVAGRVEPARR